MLTHKNFARKLNLRTIMGQMTLCIMALLAVLPAQAGNETVREISWQDLMPKMDNAVIERFNAGEMSRTDVQDYVSSMGNTPIKDMHNTVVRIPGYLVPLNVTGKQTSTEMLLVPTMGACVHVPAPPPNQTVYVEYPEGISITEAGYTPYWLEGKLTVKSFESEVADTLYTLKVTAITEYE